MDVHYSTNVPNVSETVQSNILMENNQTSVMSDVISAKDFAEYRWSLWVQAAFGVFIVFVGILGNLCFLPF